MAGDPGEIRGPVAIIALHPKHGLKQSVERLLTSLRRQDVAIVAVVNESPAAINYQDLLDRLATVTLYRSNIGRDFGAYQAGYNFLLKEGKDLFISRLLFANDSVLYTEGCETPIEQLVKSPDPALGLWMSLDVTPHLQSFLFGLSAETAFSAEVRRFWASYYPTPFKKTAINRGEIGLSRAIIKAGAPISGLATDKYLFGSSFSDLPHALILDELVSLRQRCFVESTPMAYTQVRQDQVGSAADQAAAIRLMARIALSTRNGAHALGLYATRVHHFPLKLDLVKAGTCSLDTYCEVLKVSEVPSDELFQIRNMLTLLGSETSITGIRKFLRQYGYDT